MKCIICIISDTIQCIKSIHITTNISDIIRAVNGVDLLFVSLRLAILNIAER